MVFRLNTRGTAGERRCENLKKNMGPAPPYLQPISPLMPFEGEEITARVWINERPLVTTVIGPDLQEGSNQRDGCSFDNPPASKNCCHPWNH
ncbi:hypothetical protein TNIN_115601 [Trichonephila inaurata madagascariensis]|uniref:Uncharacterized protein n=1 Tax=Trichonephila inaurata madagascariensis TaxID=2747483 RepID=A0A8X7C428_9ARAC|nr:hypothetical protein TNIN_115601 [Trichonephila inaurata madagascariensis]